MRAVAASIGLLFATVFATALGAETAPTGLEIMQKAVQRTKWNEENNPQADYAYRQLSLRQKLDGQGAVKEQDERLFEVFYIEGLMFRRLIQKNGQKQRDGHNENQSQDNPDEIVFQSDQKDLVFCKQSNVISKPDKRLFADAFPFIKAQDERINCRSDNNRQIYD